MRGPRCAHRREGRTTVGVQDDQVAVDIKDRLRLIGTAKARLDRAAVIAVERIDPSRMAAAAVYLAGIGGLRSLIILPRKDRADRIAVEITPAVPCRLHRQSYRHEGQDTVAGFWIAAASRRMIALQVRGLYTALPAKAGIGYSRVGGTGQAARRLDIYRERLDDRVHIVVSRLELPLRTGALLQLKCPSHEDADDGH